jgi:parvulin-like peptidyl-prolyl isomerase
MMSFRSLVMMAFALTTVCASAFAAAQTQMLDRIVATVGQQVITLSDVRAAVGLGLLPDSASLPIGVVVERLVERELMRAEIDRFGVMAPAPELLTARIDAIRKRFASQQAFDAALEAHGLSDARFRAWVSDDWRIEQYIQQRFDAASQPTDEDVLQYFQSREREFAKNGRPPRFEDIRDEVRRRLLASRRQALVDDWVAGLKRRTEIVMMHDRGAA